MTGPRALRCEASWAVVGRQLGDVWRECLQQPFAETPVAPRPPAGSLGATIGLVDVEHDLVVDVTLLATPDDACALAEMFCEDLSPADEASARETLLELANMAMGSLKRAFLEEGLRFCGMLPKAVVRSEGHTPSERAFAERSLGHAWEGRVLHTLIAARSAPRTRVATPQLREGMVLAQDVRDDAGALIAPAGVRLTESMARRLAVLVPDAQVELMDVG